MGGTRWSLDLTAGAVIGCTPPGIGCVVINPLDWVGSVPHYQYVIYYQNYRVPLFGLTSLYHSSNCWGRVCAEYEYRGEIKWKLECTGLNTTIQNCIACTPHLDNYGGILGFPPKYLPWPVPGVFFPISSSITMETNKTNTTYLMRCPNSHYQFLQAVLHPASCREFAPELACPEYSIDTYSNLLGISWGHRRLLHHSADHLTRYPSHHQRLADGCSWNAWWHLSP